MGTVRDRLEAAFARCGDATAAHVFVKLFERTARAEADAADLRRAAGIRLGPLDGTLVSVKDLFDVAGETTTAGSRLLAGAAPALADAPVVRRLPLTRLTTAESVTTWSTVATRVGDSRKPVPTPESLQPTVSMRMTPDCCCR